MILLAALCPVVDLFGVVASTFFRGVGNVSDIDAFDVAGNKTSVIDVNNQTEWIESPFLNIILEIILAIQRLVDSEMVSIALNVQYKFVWW